MVFVAELSYHSLVLFFCSGVTYVLYLNINLILSVETSAFAFSISLMNLLLFKHFSNVLTASMNETSSFLLVGIVTAYIFINNFKNLRKII